MLLTTKLTKKIINEVKEVIPEEQIIIVNDKGIIIASTDLSRIDNFHEGAKIVMEKKEKLYITNDLSKDLIGVKPGINLPISFEKNIIGVIGITGIPNTVEPFAEIIRRLTELLIREANYMEKKEWETRGFESFIYEWIYTNKIDREFRKRAEILGVSLANPYQCVLFHFDEAILAHDSLQVESNMEEWFASEYRRRKGDILVRWGNNRFLLFKNHEDQVPNAMLAYELKKWQDYFKEKYGISFAVGIGKTIEKESIRKTYEEAEKAVGVAIKKFDIVFYESLILDIVLEEISESARDEFKNKVLYPVSREADLVTTLRTYLKNNQSLKQSAEELHIHINTLHYRLNQIKHLTNIDPKSSKGVALFYVALSLTNIE